MINSVFNMTIDGRAENSPDQIDVINPATEACRYAPSRW